MKEIYSTIVYNKRTKNYMIFKRYKMENGRIKTTTKHYNRYLVEQYLGRQLEPYERVLIINREEEDITKRFIIKIASWSQKLKKYKRIYVKCPVCGKYFNLKRYESKHLFYAFFYKNRKLPLTCTKSCRSKLIYLYKKGINYDHYLEIYNKAIQPIIKKEYEKGILKITYDIKINELNNDIIKFVKKSK